jgi:hypothetical protein
MTPLVATWLIQRTRNDLVPAYLVMAAALVSLVAAMCPPDRSRAETARPAP